MATATPTQAYATPAEADAFLELKEDWLDLDEPVKLDALLAARYYIDAKFNCVVDYDAIDEEVKFANSLLAYDYFIQGDLFFNNSKNVKTTLVKAGSVETEKEYFGGNKEVPNSLGKVKAILQNVCTFKQGNLVRV